ncbi:MAG: alpha/beta hydrolase [Planctomycetota bacterium]
MPRLATLATLLLPSVFLSAQDHLAAPGIAFTEVKARRSDTVMREGWLEVAEDPAHPEGRRIRLHVMVLPARNGHPKPDPVFFLAGGPGQGAATMAEWMLDEWVRDDRDLVLVDQRGTGLSNPLRVETPGNDDDPAGYLKPIFVPENFAKARVQLEKHADLRFYTTPIAMDDLDAVRAALGYEKIDLYGGSYGTRAALVYMRQHHEHVRCAILDGVAPIAFENPLHHARSAQDGLDRLAEECAADPARHAAYPDLHADMATILAKLAEHPVDVAIDWHGKQLSVPLDRDSFTGAFRILMYSAESNRRAPLLLHRAAQGDFGPFAELAIASNRNLNASLALGMLMCVTASEDLSRITEDEIVRECKDTFLGESRVRAQLAVAKVWPKGELPDDYAQPVAVDVPTLLLSGTHDPVTPPRWGAEAASHLKNSLHVVVDGCHGVGQGPRMERLMREFLDRASVEDLDQSGIDEIRMDPIVLPDTHGR